jgi:hypothetical protein
MENLARATGKMKQGKVGPFVGTPLRHDGAGTGREIPTDDHVPPSHLRFRLSGEAPATGGSPRRLEPVQMIGPAFIPTEDRVVKPPRASPSSEISHPSGPSRAFSTEMLHQSGPSNQQKGKKNRASTFSTSSTTRRPSAASLARRRARRRARSLRRIRIAREAESRPIPAMAPDFDEKTGHDPQPTINTAPSCSNQEVGSETQNDDLLKQPMPARKVYDSQGIPVGQERSHITPALIGLGPIHLPHDEETGRGPNSMESKKPWHRLAKAYFVHYTETWAHYDPPWEKFLSRKGVEKGKPPIFISSLLGHHA